MEAAFPEHLICNQIGHALQKDHAVLRNEQLIQLCISFNCLEAFSCTHVPVSADAPVAFFVKSLHGGDIDPSGFAKGKYGSSAKADFPLPLPPVTTTSILFQLLVLFYIDITKGTHGIIYCTGQIHHRKQCHSSGSLAQAHACVDDRFLAKLLQDQLCCRLFGYMRRKDMITYLRADSLLRSVQIRRK